MDAWERAGFERNLKEALLELDSLGAEDYSQ